VFTYLVSAQFSWWEIVTAVRRFNDYLFSIELYILMYISRQVYLPFFQAQRKMKEYSNKADVPNDKRMKKELSLFFFYLFGPLAQGSTTFIPEVAEKEVIDWSGGIRDAAAILAGVAMIYLIMNQSN
jgi:hypothetical protein